MAREFESELEAVLYFQFEGVHYRCKVFPQTVWLEQQRPHGDNVPFSRSEWDFLYNGQEWSLTSLLNLVSKYQAIVTQEMID